MVLLHYNSSNIRPDKLHICMCYFFALSFVQHVMKKKIFVAGKDPSKFFWKKVSYMMYPYTASILGAFLGFLGPAYYYHFKMMGEKKGGR